MNKRSTLLSFFFLLLFFGYGWQTSLSAQSLEILDAPEQPISGSPDGGDISSLMYVKNTDTVDKEVVGFRRVLEAPQGSENRFCWGIQCWLPSMDTAGDIVTIDSVSVDSTFKGYYTPYSNPGMAKIEYCFYVENNPQDSTCAIVRYDATSSVSIQEREQNGTDLSFSPNPARKDLKVRLEDAAAGTIRIRSILGEMVLEERVRKSEGSLQLDVSPLDEGLHFLTFEGNDGGKVTKKLMIGSE